MGEILDSDWSTKFLLRSDWSGPSVASITTFMFLVEDDVILIKLNVKYTTILVLKQEKLMASLVVLIELLAKQDRNHRRMLTELY